MTRREAHALAMWIVADTLDCCFSWEDFPNLTDAEVLLVETEIDAHIELCREAAVVAGAALAKQAMP